MLKNDANYDMPTAELVRDEFVQEQIDETW